jgi:uncharacterized protein YebE (UPF0316 family)
MFNWINKAIVFTITLSGVYIYSETLLTIIEPYLISGLIGYVQLFTFGFFIGYVGGMAVDNAIKLGVNVFKVIKTDF